MPSTTSSSVIGGLGLLDRDHALVADLLHRVGDHLADRLVAVGRDRADLGDLFGGLHLLGAAFDVFDDGRRRHIDAALEIHRVHAGGDQFETLLHDRGGQHRRGGGAVAGIVTGLRGHLAHHLGAHVLELVFEFDLLGDGDAVLGDAGRAVGLVENDVAALGTQRHLDGVVEDIDAAQQSVTGVGGEAYVFGGHGFTPWFEVLDRRLQAAFFFEADAPSIMPTTSDSFIIKRLPHTPLWKDGARNGSILRIAKPAALAAAACATSP